MSKERILVAGAPGSGKTYSWLTIARMVPDSKFYVIDPDDGVRRVAYETDSQGNRTFPDLSNIEYYYTPKWYHAGSEKVPSLTKLDDPEMKAFVTGIADAWKTIRPKLRQQDWIVIEHLGNIWSRAQDAFADEVFDKDIGQYFLERRKAMKVGSKRLDALAGWTDWSVINKLHNDDFMIPVCFESQTNVFATTSFSVQESSDIKEDAEIKSFYGDTKIRLDGQKHNPYRMQSIFILKRSGDRQNGSFIMNTFLKDRGRKWIEEKQWSDFYLDYLVAEAGW